MPSIANVALTDTFDTWRVRTNEVINKIDQFETIPVFIVSKSSVIQVDGIGTLGNTVNITSNALPTTGGTMTGDIVIGSTTILANGMIIVGAYANTIIYANGDINSLGL